MIPQIQNLSDALAPMLALSMPGWPEIILILAVMLIFFGAKRLPELARGLAQSLNEFKKAKGEFDHEIDRASQELTLKEAKDKQPHNPSV